jgi:16S rRNA (guanine966-N2)-methyltransferase
MRVIAGRWRGRSLQAPRGTAIRPTSDRAREALFDILEHGEPPLRGARFLDLFCGTGAIGIEACSRGAEDVVLIDRAPEALQLTRANLVRMGSPSGVRVIVADAAHLGAAPCAFDLVFLDPPYLSDLALPALECLRAGWLATEARVIVEQAARERLEPPAGYGVEQVRRYGAAAFWLLLPQS